MIAWAARLAAICCALIVLGATPAGASAQPVEMAAPYEYLGWGEPQPPTSVMVATGIPDFTLAFILTRGRCNPEWDGERPLLGGTDQRTIEDIRASGGEVDVSFGGWSGKKLGNSCRTPTALAGAYQKAIDAYSLQAIDIDSSTSRGSRSGRSTAIGSALAARAQAMTAAGSANRRMRSQM